MEDAVKRRVINAVIIALVLLISLSVLLAVTLTREDGDTVVITLDGTTVGEYPLNKDAEYTLNGGANVLTVKDGAAYMSYSECPDHTCERTGKIRYVGQQIVCLPGGITITVCGESEGGVDFVS